MKSFVALSLTAAALATPMPQASSSAGCASSFDGTFQISTVLPSKKRQADTLVVSLKNGILTDARGRIGYIASNSQFQFDAPVQAGALQQSGFSVCGNSSLALDGSTTWYQCLSGDFYNLYSKSTGAQCSPINIQAVEKGSSGSAASQIPDGQPQATSAGVSQISDGQVQASSAKVVTQISDGQVQATSAVSMSKPAVVTQISDGQIQASAATSMPKPVVVTQISDGQIQASAAVSMSKPAVVTQISDGQIQASSAVSASKPAVVTQISDGQIQASSAVSASKPAVSASKPAVVTQISDGQIQASAATSRAPVANATITRPAEFTGAAASGVVPMGALAAGLFGLFAMF